MMHKIMLAALAAGAALVAVAPAQAAQGCGDGFHRGPYGGCRPNRRGVVIAPVVPSVGVYYRDRGYWDGQRYWQHRDRWHGGWRYR